MSTVDKVISLAKNEVGYHEGYSNGHWNNKEKYAAQVPGLAWADYQAWCATFVSWCLYESGLDKDAFYITASVAAARDWAKKNKRFSEYPAIGAQAIFGVNGDVHTGLVYGYDDTYIYTVEGNTNINGSAEGDGVYYKKRLRKDPFVYGYSYPKYPEGIVSADPAWKDQAPKPAPTTPKPIKGIDVSSHQDAAYSLNGADFVVVKATEGANYVNPNHAAQVKRGRDAKVVVGHYHFMRPGDVKAQADFFLKNAAPLPGEFLAVDWEDTGVSCADKDAFIHYLQSKAGGRKVILYCNTTFWLNRDTTSFAGDGLWIAQYGVEAGKPAIQAAWLMHQYTDTPQDTSITHWASRADMAKWADSPAPAPKPAPKPPTPAPKPKPKPAPKYVPFDKLPPTHLGSKSPIWTAMGKRLVAEGCGLYKVGPGSTLGPADIASYEKWQRKLGFTGKSALWPPGPASWNALKVPA